MLQIENLTKSYGSRQLFDQISFKFNPRERLGIVGLNGHGKTTLMRLIIGEESADEGNIVVPRNYRIGYVRQSLKFSAETVLMEGASALPAQEEGQLWRVEKILAGLGFSATDLERRPRELSGGFQVRLNLAKTIVAEPDLLLLDEPTNFLDITSIRWIEQFLSRWPRELMLITHDRSFMDKVVTHVLGIHRRSVRKIQGDTAKYYQQIAQDEEIYEKTRLNDERRTKEIELFISRFRAKARLAGMVQSRIKTLDKIQKKDKLTSIKTLEFQFRSCPFPGKQVMRIQHLSFAYPGQPALINNFALAVATGDRVCVVGPNGRGKSTLMRLLAGTLTASGGQIKYHPR
jgi:ATP-binding cassette subfamily F protein 3